MNSSDSIEVSAATVDEAIEQALGQLGAAEDDVKIEVLSTPRTGLLGLGARPAKVRVTRFAPQAAQSAAQSPPPPRPAVSPAPEPAVSTREPEPEAPPAPNAEASAPERTESRQAGHADVEVAEEGNRETRQPAELDEQGRDAVSLLERILELMGEKAEVAPGQTDSDGIAIDIKGDGSGVLIGRHGQTLDALEYLVNRIVARRIKDAATIVLDSESYRARRRRQLHRMALSKAEEAKREHTAITLEPMPPRDRRIVHLALKDDPMVTTRSTGDGFMRSIEIVPANGGSRPVQAKPRRPERERQRPDTIGQQGGFARGQKRIV